MRSLLVKASQFMPLYTSKLKFILYHSIRTSFLSEFPAVEIEVLYQYAYAHCSQLHRIQGETTIILIGKDIGGKNSGKVKIFENVWIMYA